MISVDCESKAWHVSTKCISPVITSNKVNKQCGGKAVYIKCANSTDSTQQLKKMVSTGEMEGLAKKQKTANDIMLKVHYVILNF